MLSSLAKHYKFKLTQEYKSLDKNIKQSNKYFHLVGGGVTCWVIWQSTTFLGIVLGSFIPEKLGLSFAVPLTFLALLELVKESLVDIIQNESMSKIYITIK